MWENRDRTLQGSHERWHSRYLEFVPRTWRLPTEVKDVLYEYWNMSGATTVRFVLNQMGNLSARNNCAGRSWIGTCYSLTVHRKMRFHSCIVKVTMPCQCIEALRITWKSHVSRVWWVKVRWASVMQLRGLCERERERAYVFLNVLFGHVISLNFKPSYFNYYKTKSPITGIIRTNIESNF